MTERDNIIPIFYMKPVRNNFQSEQEGRDIWEEVAYVEMIVPGDKLTEAHAKVKQEHKDRWPDKWAAFIANQEAPTDGTPLDAWPPINRALAMQLSSAKVRTVEALADLSDAQLSNVLPMGGNGLREKARIWLKQAADMAPVAEMQAALAARDVEVEALKAQLADLAKRIPAKQEEAA